MADATTTPPTEDWSPPETARLKQLWDQGLTGPQIAAKLNAEFGTRRGRMSVIGRARRDNLPKRSPESKSLHAKAAARGGLKGKSAKPDEDGPSPERKAGLGKVWIKKPRLLPGQTPEKCFPITEIPPGGCKYALTANAPHRFCGRPAKPGKSYCEPHAKGLTQPAGAPGNPHARETAKDADA